jgi:hypothetical protein
VRQERSMNRDVVVAVGRTRAPGRSGSDCRRTSRPVPSRPRCSSARARPTPWCFPPTRPPTSNNAAPRAARSTTAPTPDRIDAKPARSTCNR